MESVALAIGTVTNSLGIILALKENVQTLQEQVNALEISKKDLLHWIADAETHSEQAIQLVEWWLTEVETLQHEWKQINSDGHHLFRFNVWSRYWVSKRALEKLEAATDLLRTVQAFMMMEMAEERVSKSTIAADHMSRLTMVGRDHTFQQLKDYVQGDGGLFCLYGMGGVGKTMMLQKLKAKLAHDFDVVVMVEVSENYKEEGVQFQIGSQLGLDLSDNETKQARRSCIYEYLKVKKFLLILDDVWDYVDFYSIGIPEPDSISKSKIVVATRIAKVGTFMRAKNTMELNCLSRQSAWAFFLEIVGREFICSNPEIAKHAMAIVKKCGGIPLALQTIGLAMSSKRSREEWKQAITCMDTNPSMIFGIEKKIFHCLKRSYDRLDSDELRRCFLHCSLYPEGHVVDKHALAEIFIKHGILDIQDGKEAAYSKGLDLISRLRSMCMLEIETGFYGKDKVKMHSMIRSLALWIASGCGKQRGNMLVRGGADVEEALDTDKLGNLEVASLMENSISSLPTRLICRKLDTLLLIANSAINKVSREFFMHMPSLRVLDLSRTQLEELPLEISKCANMQYLVLCHTKLKSLPDGLGYLRKLRYLDISHTVRLQTMPRNVIPRLNMLQVLNASPCSYDNWEVGPTDALVGGVPLEELEGLVNLKNLGITIKSKQALQKLSSSARLASMVDNLHLSKLEGIQTIGFPMPTLGQHMRKLRRLKLYSCNELHEVVIGSCGSDTVESPSKTLEYLELWCLEKMSRIVYNQPKASQFLHRLREFRIYGCGIQEVINPETDLALPNLQCLYLGDLQELRSICRSMSSLPRLRFLGVYMCPNLKSLPSGVGSCRSLKHICGKREWWDELEWEDDGERSSLEALLNRHQH